MTDRGSDDGGYGGVGRNGYRTWKEYPTKNLRKLIS